MGFLFPKAPSLPPPVDREDPAIAARKKEVRLSALKRSGRAASFFASRDEDKLGTASVERPAARKLG